MQSKLKHTSCAALPLAGLLGFAPLVPASTPQEPSSTHDELNQEAHGFPADLSTEEYAYPTYQREAEEPAETEHSRPGWYGRAYEDERYSQPPDWRYGFHAWGW
jgi:hypothetical protein